MKASFLLSLLLICLSPLLPAQITVNTSLSGKILNFGDLPDADYIDLNISTVFGPNFHVFKKKIAPDGSFSFDFFLSSDQDVELNYLDQAIPLLVRKGEQAYVDLDGASLTIVQIRGYYQGENSTLAQYWNTLAEMAVTEFDPHGNKELSDRQYKEKRLADLNRARQDFNRFFIGKPGFNATLKTWLMQYLDYGAAANLLVFPFAGKLNRELADSSDYFNFKDVITSQTQSELINSQYFNYIYYFVNDLNIIKSLNRAYEEEKKQRGGFATVLSIVDRRFQGPDKAAALSNLFYAAFFRSGKTKEQAEACLDTLYRYVGDEYVLQMITGQYKSRAEEEPFSQLLEKFEADSTFKEQIDGIVGANTGKTVFIDVWAVWCGPCRQELPRYKAALEQNPDVDFLFLCIKSDPEAWEKLKTDHGLPGRHYLLNDNQLAFFETMGAQSYPAHFLIQNDRIIRYGSPGDSEAHKTFYKIIEALRP